MLDRQAAALEYLARIAGGQSRSSLESMEVSSVNIVEGLRVSDTLDAEERTLVDRTIDKIASGRSLEAHEQFALEAIIIPDQRPVIDVREGNSFSTDHPLWQENEPPTLVIDEVERIWTAIDERDDWQPLNDKIAAIRRLGDALGEPPPRKN